MRAVALAFSPLRSDGRASPHAVPAAGGLSDAQLLALAAESRHEAFDALYTAYKAALADVRETRNDPVPLHLRNAPTGLMKDLGYGDGYRYAHDYEGGVVAQKNFPDALVGRRYYEPTGRGFEDSIRLRLEEIRARQAEEPE